MKASNGLVTFLCAWEGYCPIAKKDPCTSNGLPITIGYGTTLIDGKPIKEGLPCTVQQAIGWLHDELDQKADVLWNHICIGIPQNEFDALLSLAYNVGVSAVIKSDLLRLVHERKVHAAANEFSQWAHCGGKTVQGLVNRRNAEANMFLWSYYSMRP